MYRGASKISDVAIWLFKRKPATRIQNRNELPLIVSPFPRVFIHGTTGILRTHTRSPACFSAHTTHTLCYSTLERTALIRIQLPCLRALSTPKRSVTLGSSKEASAANVGNRLLPIPDRAESSVSDGAEPFVRCGAFGAAGESPGFAGGIASLVVARFFHFPSSIFHFFPSRITQRNLGFSLRE